MKIKLLDRILLAAVSWRLARFRPCPDRADKFADGMAAVLVVQIGVLKGPIQKRLNDCEREQRQAEEAKAKAAHQAAALEEFKSFEPGNGLRLQ